MKQIATLYKKEEWDEFENYYEYLNIASNTNLVPIKYLVEKNCEINKSDSKFPKIFFCCIIFPFSLNKIC